jgi:hypothetical protein
MASVHAHTQPLVAAGAVVAFVALRQGRGNLDLAGEPLKTVCLTHFSRDIENGRASSHVFVAAEHDLKAVILDSRTTGKWRLDDADCHSIEAIFRSHCRPAWFGPGAQDRDRKGSG